MNKPEKLIIGYSLPGSIMVGSHEYTSKTSCKKEKDGRFRFKNSTTKRATTPDCFDKSWMPKTLIFIINLFKKPENKSEIIMNIMIAVTIIINIYFIWTYKSPETKDFNFWKHLMQSVLIISVIFLVVNIYISKWHAAEHMAIACYNDIKSFEPDDIKKYNRVDPNCGSRLFVLMMLISILYQVLLSKYFLNIHPLLEAIIFFELTIYYDKYIVIIKTPILREITFWLQRHILTKDPDDLQIETASISVGLLIAAHELEEENSVTFLKASP